MKNFTIFTAGVLLMTLATFASAKSNENWLVQRAKMDGSAAAAQAKLYPPKTPEQIIATNEYAGKAIAANPSNYKH